MNCKYLCNNLYFDKHSSLYLEMGSTAVVQCVHSSLYANCIVLYSYQVVGHRLLIAATIDKAFAVCSIEGFIMR